jgi:hypothetical protein
MRFVAKRFVRESKQAEVEQLRERIFGPHRGLPGERWFARPLDGKTMRQWYFPSKYSFQNFRLDEYFEMQNERFAPRPVHPAVTQYASTVQRIVQHRDTIERFLADASDEQFQMNPVLRDLRDLHSLLFLSSPAAEEEQTEVAIIADQQDELTFLLETLRAHSGARSATSLAQKIHEEGLSFSAARKAIFEELKNVSSGIERPADQKVDMTANFSEEQKKQLTKRYRFIDPLYRRRRVKWMERLLTQKHSAQELKHHSYYKTHPDQIDTFPTNMGPATIKWPSPYQ